MESWKLIRDQQKKEVGINTIKIKLVNVQTETNSVNLHNSLLIARRILSKSVSERCPLIPCFFNSTIPGAFAPITAIPQDIASKSILGRPS